ncbi:MAG: hypothetical protein NTY42_18885 [Planctomycetota bacterium]|nr:hypothetical protein [Planctomycetota bacterium]
MHKEFVGKANRLNQLATWEPPILDLRYATTGDCGHFILESIDTNYGVRHEEGKPSEAPYYRRDPAPIKVRQIIDEKTILAEVNGVDAMIEGLQTRTLTDDQAIRVDSIGYVHSTKQFKTLLGATRTVNLIKIISDENAKKIKEYVVPRIPIRKDFRHSRQWKDTQSNSLVFGAVIRNDAKTIVIVDDDGTEVSIEISKLSAIDRQYLKDISRKQ